MALISHHTVSSGIVKDILAEIAGVSDSRKYVTGGIGAQLFLPPKFHRVTSDIDIESPEKLSSGSYHQFVMSFCQPLVYRGYHIDFEKQRITYDAVFTRDNCRVILQAPKRTERKFAQLKRRLEREAENAVTLSHAGGKLRVISPSDLIARKIGRVDVFAREYNLLPNTATSAEEAIERANILKRNLDFSDIDPKEYPKKVASIRMLADIADILALAQTEEIDAGYIRKAVCDYPTQDKKSLDSLLSQILGI